MAGAGCGHAAAGGDPAGPAEGGVSRAAADDGIDIVVVDAEAIAAEADVGHVASLADLVINALLGRPSSICGRSCRRWTWCRPRPGEP